MVLNLCLFVFSFRSSGSWYDMCFSMDFVHFEVGEGRSKSHFTTAKWGQKSRFPTQPLLTLRRQGFSLLLSGSGSARSSLGFHRYFPSATSVYMGPSWWMEGGGCDLSTIG